MFAEIVTAIGLLFVIEGLFYGGFPAFMRKMLEHFLSLSDRDIRISGLTLMAMGVIIVWCVRLL